MSRKQIVRKSPQRKKSDRQTKHLTLHSRSKDRSSSGDEKKSESSLKKILYKHEIFDKRNSMGKFKTLHRIKQEQCEPIKQYKSSEDLNWKDNLIQTIQQLGGKHSQNVQSEKNQLFKQKQSTERVESKEDSRKNIEVLQIENHQIIQQGEQNTPIQFFQPQIQVVQTFIPSLNRDQQIFYQKYQTNTKFLMAQTSELLSYNKFMVLSEQLAETKKKITELNLVVRKYRIDMRNHEYTKQINFTFPVKKHNDEILVKMPESVEEKQMNRYYLMVQKLQNENTLFNEQQKKINNLESYYQTLSIKYNPVLSMTKDTKRAQNLLISKHSATNLNTKLKKSTSNQHISSKQSNIASSLQSVNTIRNSETKVASSSHLGVTNEKQLLQIHHSTLLQKKQSLIDNLKDLTKNFQNKSNRLNSQIDLLKQQIAMIDSATTNTEENKTKLLKQIDKARKKKVQDEENNQQSTQRQYQTLAQQRRLKYEKQKQQKTIEKNGFTMSLRQNKSLSPMNFVSSPLIKKSAQQIRLSKQVK